MTILRMTEEEWNASRGDTPGDAEASRTKAAQYASGPWIVQDRLFDLRDFFAGQALKGALACSEILLGTPDKYAEFAYAHADAMLKERAKGQS